MTRSPSPGKWRYPKTAPTPGRKCVDCVKEGFADTKRPAPHPGPRCATHDREVKRNRRLASKIRHVEKTYDMTDEEYNALYAYQGGRCALCRRANGTSKRLAVDHDHRANCGHDPSKGCKACTRGLLCSVCNDILAHARDDASFGHRLAAYLIMWPTRRMKVRKPWPPTPGSV